MILGLSMLFAPRDAYEACGMFTTGHMIMLFMSFALLVLLVLISKKMTKSAFHIIIRILAVLVVILELIKIGFNFSLGYTWLDAWFPISFCSIFIYALVLSGFTKGRLKEMGEAYLAGATIVAGFAFLLFPTTSLIQYPMWHYLSIHSMLFHTLMIYVGIMYMTKTDITLGQRELCNFIKLFSVFAILAVILNTAFHSNLMIMREPYNIPIPFLHVLYKNSPWGYTVIATLTYLLIPFTITALMFRKKSRRNC